MEPKKNPKYDVHRQRGVLLNIGLIVSLIIVITAFKWTVPMGKERVPHDFSYAFQETLTMDDSRPTVFKKIELPKPKKIKVFQERYICCQLLLVCLRPLAFPYRKYNKKVLYSKLYKNIHTETFHTHTHTHRNALFVVH